MLIVQVLVLSMVMFQQTITQTCRDPDNLRFVLANALYELYSDEDFVNFSLNIIPCWSSRHLIRANTELTNQRSPTQGPESTCLIPLSGGTVVTVNRPDHRAMCRWEYVIDFDENRIPKRLATAVCSCSHCHRGSCRPVNSYIPVLRKECDINTGRYVFRKYIQELPVGCVCVRGRRVPQGYVFRHQSIRMME